MKLFLDDIRDPSVCATYMHLRVGARNPEYLEDWKVVRNYEEFITAITEEMPTLISFDHDLAAVHYDPDSAQESFEYYPETGADCAKWLRVYCAYTGLPLPECWIHSMNPVGSENIKNILLSR